MKRDSVMIAVLSVGIVVVIGVTAAVMYQSSQKITKGSSAAETTAVVQTTGSETSAAVKETTAAAASSAASSAATSKTTQTAAPSLTATPSPSPSPTAAPAIADGSYNAYITAVSSTAPDAGSQGTITVRIAQIYSGAEAIAKAKADGHADFIEIDEDGNEYIPNDYYISDTSTNSLVLPVLKSCSIRVIPPDGPVTTSDDYCVDGTLQNLSDDTAEYERFATITVSGGSVSMVGEFYLP